MASQIEIQLLADIDKAVKDIARFQKETQKSFKKSQSAASGFGRALGDVGKIAAGILSAQAINRGLDALASGFRTAVKEAVELENALLGLRSVANATGQSVSEVEQAARELASDGLIPLADVSASLKNLLATGLDADQAISLFKSLRDAAAFNRQGQLSLAQAVKGATDGIKNQNSILIDNAGVTKNLSVIYKEYAASIGTTVGRLTDAQKVQAAYLGITKEAALFQGDYNRLLGTFSGVISRVQGETRFLAAEVGDLVIKNKAAIAALNVFGKILRQLRGFIGRNSEELRRLVSRGIIALVRAVEFAVVGFLSFLDIIDEIDRGIKNLTNSLRQSRVSFLKFIGASEQAIKSQQSIIDNTQKQISALDTEIDERRELTRVAVEGLEAIASATREQTRLGDLQTEKFVKNEQTKRGEVSRTRDAQSKGATGAAAPGRAAGGGGGGGSLGGQFGIDAKNIGEVVGNDFITGFIPALGTAIKQGGEQGAITVASAFANAILPGAGQLVEILALGAETLREQIFSIIDAFPDVIANITEAVIELPVILAEAFPKLIEKLTSPEFIQRIITAFVKGLITNGPRIAVAVAKALVQAVPAFIKAAAEGIAEAISQLVGGIGSDEGVFGTGILGSEGLLGIEGVPFLQDGGIVPGTGNTDSQPAVLTPGELVVDRNTTDQLQAFLQRTQGEGENGGQPMTVNLQIGEEQLANVLLNLNRQGFRTEA